MSTASKDADPPVARAGRTRPTDDAGAPPLRQLLVVALVLAASVAVTAWLIASRQEVVGDTPEREVPRVEVTEVALGRVPVTIDCTGRLEPVRRLEVASQLAARVARIGSGFDVGERVAAGDLLFELEATDAQLALAHAEASLASAEAALELEVAGAETAVAEWKLVREGEPGPLVRREPQLAAARAAVATANVEVERARTDLARTRVVAPFDGRIATRDVDLGQYVVPGASVGTLIGDDAWEVRLAVAGADQPFLVRPSADATPRVELTFGDAIAPVRIDAHLVRVAPQVDPRTQTLQAFARIEGADAERAAHFGAGSFVRATIEGRVLDGAVVLPRSALRGGDEVLVVGAASRVFRRPVRIARRNSREIVVVDGLQTGERVVTSELLVAADGMPVDILDAVAFEERRGDSARADGAERSTPVEVPR